MAMKERGVHAVLHGSGELVSPWMSNRWRIYQGTEEIARLRRLGRIHVSLVTMRDGTRLLIEPHEYSVVRALDADRREVGRITRRSWLGRRWDLTSNTFSYELVSHPRPRRWQLMLGQTPVADITGSLVSYNRVKVESFLAIPVVAVVLAWHVIARPWEAAAAPRSLIPAGTHPLAGKLGGVTP
jgi:hypothetical protein